MTKFARLSIMINIVLLLVIFLSGCKTKGEVPVVTGDSEITIQVGADEPHWRFLVDAQDAEDGDIFVEDSYVDSSEIDMNVIGVFSVIYNIPDSDGNKTKFTLTVNIIDTTAPRLVLYGAVLIKLTVGDEFIDPGYYIEDNYDESLTADIIGQVDTNSVGEYLLSYTATDSNGNVSAIITRLVIVSLPPQMVSNKDDVYYSLDDFVITKEDLYLNMINGIGLNKLLDLVDSMILSDFVDEVTTLELEDEINRITFYTTDQTKIDDLDIETYQDMVDVFNQSLIEVGIDPNNSSQVEELFILEIAKRKAFVEYYLLGDLDESYYITETTLESVYNNQVKGDVCALELRFSSETEAYNVFNNFNLVPDYNNGFGLYTGVTPIEDVAVSAFDESNTTVLTNEEVFSYFVKIYNYLNPSLPQIDEEISQSNLCLNHPDITNYVFENIMNEYGSSQVYYQYMEYIFDELNTTDNQFTYYPEQFNDNEMFVFKVSQVVTPAFDTLTDLEKDELELDYLNEYLISNSDEITNFMLDLRDEFEFNIVEPNLGVLYEFQISQLMDSSLNPTLMATLGEEEITVDMFYEYVEKTLRALSIVDLLGKYNLINNGTYVELYGDDFDILTNESYKMTSFRDEFYTIKEYFYQNAYIEYGFDSNIISWDEFLFLAFGSINEEDAIMDLFVYQSLTNPDEMSDYDFDLAEEYVQYQFENYFDLDVEHLLLYIDFNNDFVPDDFIEYSENLNETDLIEFEGLMTSFENLVRDKYESGMSFDEMTTEYNNNLVGDISNEWAIYKQYGFILKTENLSNGLGSLNNYNTTSFDSDFRDSLKRIYDEYLVLQNNSVSDIPSYLDTEMTETVFGLHLILSTKGDDFIQPTAYFDDTLNPLEYTIGSGNTGDLPTQEQLTLYKTIIVDNSVNGGSSILLPQSVSDAIDYYYGPLFDNAIYVNSFLVEASEDILVGNGVFTENNIVKMEKIADYYNLLLERINDYN